MPTCDIVLCFLAKIGPEKSGPPVYFWLSKLAHWSTIGRPKWTYLDKSVLAHFWLDLASQLACMLKLESCSALMLYQIKVTVIAEVACVSQKLIKGWK